MMASLRTQLDDAAYKIAINAGVIAKGYLDGAISVLAIRPADKHCYRSAESCAHPVNNPIRWTTPNTRTIAELTARNVTLKLPGQ